MRHEWLHFDEALERLRHGNKLKRFRWEEGRYISLNSERNIIYLTEPDSIYEVKYEFSNADILAYDWEIFLTSEEKNRRAIYNFITFTKD